MRAIALFLIIVTLTFAEGFPEIFSSAGDEVYTNMSKYNKIKHLDIYADRPEFLESFCGDANASMQKGYALDKMQQDPETTIDKAMIKSYARELRRLASQNEAIEFQLRDDIRKLYEDKDFKSLLIFQSAQIDLGKEITAAIKAYEQKKKQEEALAIVIAKSKEAEAKIQDQKTTEPSIIEKAPLPVAVKSVKKPEQEVVKPEVIPIPESDVTNGVLTVEESKLEKKEVETPKPNISLAIEEVSPAVEEKKVLTRLEYYEQNLIHLKEELYELRESGDQEKMNCLNDITAINYWMINLLKNDRDACAARDAIKQMKSYDKSSVNSCGRDSIRYMEWHGRIKPYVGTKLFQAEAACNR